MWPRSSAGQRLRPKGSQFRSRHVFPQAAGAIALGLPAALGHDLDPESIPSPPVSAVAYVDGYGNLKTTIAYDPNRVRPGKRQHEATVSDGAFAVPHGELAFAPGSSGWTLRDGSNVRWVEIFLRGGNAWSLFDRPAPGSFVAIH